MAPVMLLWKSLPLGNYLPKINLSGIVDSGLSFLKPELADTFDNPFLIVFSDEIWSVEDGEDFFADCDLFSEDVVVAVGIEGAF